SQLPQKYRAPLVLCYLQGKTNEEAARELGWPTGSMSKRLQRGRELLRERLTRRGLALSGSLLFAVLAESAATAALPAALPTTTPQAATLFATGTITGGAIAPHVAALAQGVVKMMFLNKLKMIASCCLLAGLLIAGAGRFAYRALAGRAEAGAPKPT